MQHSTFAPFKLLFLFSLLLVLGWHPAMAQDQAEKEDKDEKKKSKKSWTLHHTLDGGYSFGIQQSNEQVITQSGLVGSYTAQLRVSNRIYYGLGFGYEQFEYETFLPIYLDFKGKLRKKDNSPYLSTQLGYAIGSNDSYLQFVDYTYRGGLFFSSGVGYKFSVKDRFSCLMSVAYKHQFAHVRYETFDGETYREELNFDLVMFRFGIILPD